MINTKLKLIDIHTHNEGIDYARIVSLAPNTISPVEGFYSMGIHPGFINPEDAKQELGIVESFIHDKGCIAIGECGIDRLAETPMEIQQTVFEAQVKLAQKYSAPLIIHCVRAFEETLEILKGYPGVKAIFHGFNRNENILKNVLINGHYISCGRSVFNPTFHDIFNAIPKDKLFLETDNSENTIEETYMVAAAIAEVELEKLATQINRNFQAVFNFAAYDE